VANIGGVIPFSTFLINNAGGGVQLITSLLHFLLPILYVLRFIGKLLITPFMTNLELVNVAIIG